jgi:hypothetical protein
MTAKWLIFGIIGAMIAFALSVIANWIPKPTWLHPIYLAFLVGLLLLAGVYVAVETPSPAAHKYPSPFVTKLPPNSPFRLQNPIMDQLCQSLGISRHAWLPGQESTTDYSGRVLTAANAAFTWSCSKDGPRITRVEVSGECQLQYPKTAAYTLDPDYAYSWVCI